MAAAASFAAQDDRTPTAVEMGASQAPWCLSWVRALDRLATREHRSAVRAVAHEAAAGEDVTRAFWSAQGLELTVEERPTGLLLRGDGWQVDWRQHAILTGGGTVRFPDVDISRDNGAQAVRETAATDYRGQPQRYREVSAVDPVDAVRECGYVHLLHMDVQGAEEEALRTGAFQEMSGAVAVVMLGTHSRSAEALAFEEMPQAGFVLVDEEPCLYRVLSGRPQLVRDGEQLWLSGDAVEHLAARGLLRGTALVALSEQRRSGTAQSSSRSPRERRSGTPLLEAARPRLRRLALWALALDQDPRR